MASPPGVVELGGWMPGCKSSGEVASSVDGLVRWSFGVGEEGIKCNGTRHDKAFIIDDKFPCWFTAARAVGLNILGIWLTSEDHIPLSYLTSITRDVAIYRGPHPLKRAMEFIGESAFILVGGVIPDLLVEDNIFDTKLKAVLTTKQINRTLPSKWMESHHKVIHSAMGGVTNGKHTVSVYSRSHTAHVFVLKGCPPQDLRSILKAGEPGNMTCNLSLPISNDAVKEVRYCRGNVIENASLMPVNQPSIKVRTQWRGQFWIERELSTFERLLAVDVPEKLIRLIPEGSERALLVDMVHSPSKSLHGFLEGFLRQSINAQIGTKRKTGMSEVIPMLGRSAKARKTSQAEDGYGGVYESASRTRLFVNKLAVIFESEFEANDEVICQTDRDVEAVSDTKHNAKATKNDDAEVRTNLWDRHLLLGLHITVQNRDTSASLEVLRRWLLAIWKRRLTRSFFSWLIKNKPCQESVLISLMKDARDCLTRSANATWWTWDAGSRPFFWRWPEDYLEVARLGAPVWLDEQVKPWTRQQKGTKDGVRREMIQSKLETIRSKQYVETGPIISLMSFFDVPKGDDDIRMVYDGSASGLNDHLWAPWFSLPTIDCLLRSLEPGYSMADNDVGEMFHNFMLNEKLRKYCGLDMSNFISKTTREAKGMKVWFRWNRLAMGLRSSPYSAVQGMMIAREVILGNKDEEANVFRWDSVRLNLPGSETYTPSQAWCTKIRKDGTVAADVFIYVDDIRCSAPTQEEAWKGSQRTSSILGFLGLQDAARKRRDPGQETGAWTGSVVWTSNQLLTVLTTQEKWDKAKSHLEWIKQNIDDANGLENKRLQSIRGFLVYVSRTYGSLVPYLKGLHATIDSWRYGRTAAGWKKGAKKLKKSESEYEENELDWEERLGLTQLSESEPLLVFPVPRFRKDLVCLIELMSSKSPPQRLGRMNTHARVIYGFGDASKHGFGASIELSDKTIFWRFGQWRLEEEYRSQSHIKNLTLMEERSSNYRELRNLVEVLESAFEEGMLQDREIFMFTDNTTAEAAFFKGTSSSELLFELVLRLRKLEMTGKCVIHMIHVAGTRMINQGTDGLSRGDKTSGVMAGDAMLSFVPLNLTAFDRSEELKSWMTKLFLDEALLEWQTIFLVANDWPDVMPNGKTYIWAPPPAIADVAGEYLAQATHKRTHSTHIFICPRLMTSRWNRIVRKATDIILTVPIGSSLWGTDQHEPLMICISFPLSRDRPWKHGGTPYCDHLGKILPSMLHSDPTRAGFELRECFLRAWRMAQL